MNWTAEQLADHYRHLKSPGGFSGENCPPGKVPAMASKPRRSANKWEQLYAEKLHGQQAMGLILWYQFEGVRFRLADDTYYKPDYVALMSTGELVAFEVKGFWREAARVRIKVAADRHPFRFIAVRKRLVKEGGGWAEEVFSAMLDRLNASRLLTAEELAAFHIKAVEA